MAAIARPGNDVQRHLEQLGVDTEVDVAVYNTPQSCVISGRVQMVESIVTSFKEEGIRATRLNVDQGTSSVLTSSA